MFRVHARQSEDIHLGIQCDLPANGSEKAHADPLIGIEQYHPAPARDHFVHVVAMCGEIVIQCMADKLQTWINSSVKLDAFDKFGLRLIILNDHFVAGSYLLANAPDQPKCFRLIFGRDDYRQR